MLKRIIAVENEVAIGYSNVVSEDVKTCGENEASGRFLIEGPGDVACCQDDLYARYLSEDPVDVSTCGESTEMSGSCGEEDLVDNAACGEEEVTGGHVDKGPDDVATCGEVEVFGVYLDEEPDKVEPCGEEEVSRQFLDACLEDVVACGQDEEPGRCLSTGIGDVDYVRLHNDNSGKMARRKSMSDFNGEDVLTNLDARRCWKVDVSKHDQRSEAHEGSTTLNWKKRKKTIITNRDSL